MASKDYTEQTPIIEIPVGHKRCIKCSTVRLRSEFNKDNLRPDKLFPYCKPCRAVKNPKIIACKSVEEVLLRYVVVDSGCWEWTGSKMTNEDYGIAHFKGKRIRAHRLSYTYHVGEIPEGLIVCHHCDNPICINPDHLYAGTQQDNSNDMVRRGRHAVCLGEDRPNSVLKEWQVLLIRKDKRKERVIAQDYGIAPSTAGSIRRKLSWKYLG